MPIAQGLADFKASVAQCESLIANAHKVDADGNNFMPAIDRQQVTTAAFLNLFISWETFLETTLTEILRGSPMVGGGLPVKFASPPDLQAAKAMIIGAQRYFDYGNHHLVTKVAAIYLQNGEPLQPHLNAIFIDLEDLRVMRNASAHITSTTQAALETLALRVLAQPSVGISLYALLTAPDPNVVGQTIFESYKAKLVVTAELIANG